MEHAHLDWETRGVLNLDEVGLDVYMSDPRTEIILGNYALHGQKVKTWEPHLNPEIPEELLWMLQDPFVTLHAWGVSFEREAALKLLKIDKPVTEWFCEMAAARYLGLPGSLDKAGAILGLGESEAKLEEGKKLIQLFCEPVDEGGEETLFGLSEPIFNTPYTHPREWARFVEYGRRDVVAETAIGKKTRKFPMPPEEIETWRLDYKINSTGWPVDHPTVDGARELVYLELEPLNKRLKELTGLQNVNSRNQILEWVQDRGYAFTSLGKDFVTRALAGECDLTPECKEVLELRGQTAKSSVSKYTALADMTSADGRLRHQYTYYGAHTGRWAAHGVNMGNLFKPTKEVESKLELAVNLVRKMDFDEIRRQFSKPLEVAASVQRSAFRAPEGFKFVWADLNAIENRGLGYIARCQAILDVFRQGLDPYLSFAVKMYDMTYEALLAEYKAGDKTKRNIAKSPVLGAGYGLGPGEEKIDHQTGLPYWTGLMAYARRQTPPVEMTREEAVYAVQVFRESYPEVKRLWKDMERAFAFAVRHPGHLTGVGVPHTKRDEEYFESKGRKIYDPIISFLCHGTKLLEMKLPSGRSLFYFDPRVEVQEKSWEGRSYQQDVLYYKSKDPKTKQWVELDTFGGHLVENGDQAICRDVLVHGMKKADAMGFEIVGSTYDECVCLAPVDGPLGEKELCECLTDPPPFCGLGLPLAAEGTEDIVYHK